MKNKKFIIVYCHGFMDSRYFQEEILETENLEMAKQYASAKCHNKQYTFDNWNFHVVEAKQVKFNLISRKLTLWERITGRIK